MREPAHLQAVGGVSFTIEPARTLAVVGESGCGKSTLARIVALIEKPTAGALDARRRRRGQGLAGASACACASRCRWCSRTPTARSIRARRSARSSRRRSRSTPTSRPPSSAERARAMLAQGRPAPRALRALSAHVLRRPAAAHRDRPRADAEPGARRRRRARLRARRLGAGAGAEPARRPAARARRSRISSSRTTSRVVRHIAHDVLVMYLGPRDGAGTEGAHLRAAAAPVHAGAARVDARASAGAAAQRIVLKGERPSPLESAAGLRVFDALPLRDRPLPHRASGAAPARRPTWSPATSRSSSSNPVDPVAAIPVLQLARSLIHRRQTHDASPIRPRAAPRRAGARRRWRCALPVAARRGASAKTLVFCSEGSPENFYPGVNTTGTSFDANSQIYSRIVDFERGGTTVVPGPRREVGHLARRQGLHVLPAQGREVAQPPRAGSRRATSTPTT